MAHHQSAQKRIRTSEKRRQVNRPQRSQLVTLTKAVRNAPNKKEGEKALSRVLPYLDKLVSDNIIHRNKANNQKSRLTKFVNRLS